MASHLHRRIIGDKTSKDSQEATPGKAEEARLAPVSKILHEKPHKYRKRRNGFIFFLGGLFGIVAAGFFAGRNDLIDFPELGDLSMDSLMDVLPAGFVRDVKDLAVSVTLL
jgi:phospholipid:diacylglycerol acyltransferase